MKLSRASLCLLLSLLTTACNRLDNPPAPPLAKHMAAAAPMADLSRSGAAEKSAPAPQGEALVAIGRHIAHRHQLTVETSATRLEQVFQETVKRCEQAGCEVLTAGLQRGSDYSPPSANLAARIPPAALNAFLSGFGADAKVIQQSRQAEDKTDAVIDTEARLRNLNELRERLRSMLATRPGKISDVLEIQRELTNTQAQLDSLNGLRNALANETEKIAVNVDFQGRASVSERGFFAPVASAWNRAGETLMSSLGSLITFVAAVLPWLLIAVPAFFGMRTLWRRWKARRTARVA